MSILFLLYILFVLKFCKAQCWCIRNGLLAQCESEQSEYQWCESSETQHHSCCYSHHFCQKTRFVLLPTQRRTRAASTLPAVPTGVTRIQVVVSTRGKGRIRECRRGFNQYFVPDTRLENLRIEGLGSRRNHCRSKRVS